MRDELEGFDEAAGTFEGRAFPSEAEWLSLPGPPISAEFVDRTIAAMQDERAAQHTNGHEEADPLTGDLLAAFAAPAPTRDFAARTLSALARPADTDDPHPAKHRGALRAWAWPLLLVAALVAVLVLLHEPARAPVELRIAQQVRPALAHAYAASPLPAVLAELDRQQDPDAPPNGEADGLWLLQRRNR